MSISAIGSSGGFSLDEMASTMFKKLDANGDGGIDKSELKTAMSKMPSGKQGAPSVDEIFIEADTNEDGTIDEAENKAMVKKMGAQAGGPPPAGGAAPGGGPKGGAGVSASTETESTQSYEKEDMNQDGKVTNQEEIEYAMKHPYEAYKSEGVVASLAVDAQGQVNVSA